MILITGATGFVGSYLALKLVEKGHLISATYLDKAAIEKTKNLFAMFEKSHLFSNINWIEADITDIPALEIALQNIEYVYHCASKTSYDPNDEKLLRKINIEGTANVVNMCLFKNVKKICYLSSIETLGDISKENINPNAAFQFFSEASEWNPEKAHSDFAISKYGAEMELWRGQQEGLQVVIVNPGILLGPMPKTWNRNDSGFKLIEEVATGAKFYNNGATGFVGVQDVVSCMIQLMESVLIGKRYILVSENLSFKQFSTLTAEAFNVNSPQKVLQKWQLEVELFWNWIKANLFFQKRKLFRADVQFLTARNYYANEKIKSQLNFNFQPIASVIKEIAEKY